MFLAIPAPTTIVVAAVGSLTLVEYWSVNNAPSDRCLSSSCFYYSPIVQEVNGHELLVFSNTLYSLSSSQSSPVPLVNL